MLRVPPRSAARWSRHSAHTVCLGRHVSMMCRYVSLSTSGHGSDEAEQIGEAGRGVTKKLSSMIVVFLPQFAFNAQTLCTLLAMNRSSITRGLQRNLACSANELGTIGLSPIVEIGSAEGFGTIAASAPSISAMLVADSNGQSGRILTNH